MAQIKNPSEVKANKLFSGIYDFKYVFKDKYFFEVKEGDVLYSRGDKSEYMYLLLRGRIKLKTYDNPRLPKVYLISKNEFFGEKELIEKTVRNSSALAEKDSLLFKMSQKDFLKLSTTNKKIMENLKEKKYEEVVAPSRKNEIKDDIFKKILNEPDQKKKPPEKKGNGIELKDYSYENPLLELKARDEITDELKMYDEDKEDDLNTDIDLDIDDDGIKWELQDFKDDDEKISGSGEVEENLKDSESLPPDVEEDVLENFMRIQDQVNTFSDSLDDEKLNILDDEKLVNHDDEKVNSFLDDDNHTDFDVNEDLPGTGKDILDEYSNEEDINNYVNSEPKSFVFNDVFPKENFIKAVTRLSTGLTREETDRLIVEAAVELVNAEQGILYYPDSENKLKGRLVEEDAELVAGTGTIPEKCFLNGQLINIRDVFNDANFNPAVDYISYFHIHSLICIPVSDGEEVKAVLQLFNSREGEFSGTDEEMLKSLSPVILKSIERALRFSSNGNVKAEPVAEIPPEETKDSISEILPAITMPAEISKEKTIPLKTLSDFLLQEFQVIVGDIKQFNTYLQRIDIPGETKEIADIVTSQTTKIIDLIEALKAYSEPKMHLSLEKQDYIALFEDMINLLAEYTDVRRVNLYKRFETDAVINADPKFLYLAVFQLIKYQCELMPFGGNIFISSVKEGGYIEIIIRNATKKTDESLVISPPMEYNENTPSGVGLSLSKRIIENHNAVLEVRNQSGTGMEIAIRFPIIR